MGDMDFVELPPGVSPTGDFDDRFTLVTILEAAIAWAWSAPRQSFKCRRGISPRDRASRRTHGVCRRITRWPVVADIGLESSGFGPAAARRQHRDRYVVGAALACRVDVIVHTFNQRSRQLAGGTDPSKHERSVP